MPRSKGRGGSPSRHRNGAEGEFAGLLLAQKFRPAGQHRAASGPLASKEVLVKGPCREDEEDALGDGPVHAKIVGV